MRSSCSSGLRFFPRGHSPNARQPVKMLVKTEYLLYSPFLHSGRHQSIGKIHVLQFVEREGLKQDVLIFRLNPVLEQELS